MARAFSTSEPETALRGYLVLIGRAADRQVLTYGQLSQQIKRGDLNFLTKPLGLLTHWCQINGLPALVSLVVEQATGLPAPGFTAASRSEIPAEQVRVWDFDWFGIHPPAIEELTYPVPRSEWLLLAAREENDDVKRD
jgi:hypothetical protein